MAAEKYEASTNGYQRGPAIRKGDGYANYDADNDGNAPPYPGVIIEEMIDSASQIGSPDDNKCVTKMDHAESESVLGKDQFSAAFPQRAPVRWKHSTPMNTIMMFVPQQEAWVVERMGKYNKILEPGLNVLVPLLDKVKYVQSLKEIAIEIPQQTAITIDNVSLTIDGVLYLRIKDPYKASYGVEDPEFAITQLAQTTMRSEIGKITLDTLFRERESLNKGIVIAINSASDAWGIECLRYEIRDIRMPNRVQEAMQMQVEAERKKRAAILESEGIKSAEINVAEGKKQSRILASEAEKQELINEAQGQAEAVIAAGKARAQSIELVSKALCGENGQNAAALAVAEKYVGAFGELAKTNNTLILPANTGDVSSMVAQAMTIYGQLEGRKDLSIMQKKVLEPVAEESVIDVNASEAGSDIYSKN